MYRARVESVSGLKIRAGGKWLNCIGDRAFKVGDLVWTDGRCVYGNDRETQAPLVIANPAKEDFAIPICQLNYTTYYALDYTERRLDSATYYTFISKLVTGKETKDYPSSDTKILNDTKGNIYKTNDIAANVDKNGTVYKIKRKSPIVRFLVFQIIKDEKVITTIDFEEEQTAIANELHTLIRDELSSSSRYVQDGEGPRYYDIGIVMTDGCWAKDNHAAWVTGRTYNLTFSSLYNDFQIPWGYIHNENDFAFIVNIGETCTSGVKKQGEMSDALGRYASWGGTQRFIDYWLEINDGEIRSGIFKSYLVDNLGKHLLCKASGHYGGVFEFKGGAPYECVAGSRDDPTVKESRGIFYIDTGNELSGNEFVRLGSSNILKFEYAKKIPMQDGFYRVVEFLIPTPDNFVMLPEFANISIYNPAGEKIFSGIFSLNSYITVFQLKRNKYLLGVKELSHYRYNLNIERYDHVDNLNVYRQTVHVESGLYLCRNGKLESLSNGVLLNQYLRPMKKYKNWWERIQTLE